MEKMIYVSLDIAKYVMAVLILLGHTANEWAHLTGFWHYALSCCFTVPVFFVISGFLFFSKIETLDWKRRKEYYKKWSIRVGKMYLIWSLIYFIFVLIRWCINGFTVDDLINYLHKSLVFSTYATIWFLPALWLGVTIAFWLNKKLGMKKTCSVLAILWLLGAYFGAYYGSIPETGILRSFFDGYMDAFKTFRNGLFYGSVYSYLGYLVYKFSNKFTLKTSLLLVVLLQLLNLAEIVFIKRITPDANSDMSLLMLPLAFCIVVFLLQVNIKQRPIYTNLRNQSMLIFCGQRLFLTALPGVLPAVSAYINDLSQWGIMGVFTISVLLFTYIVDKLSVSFPVLTYLR